jgi:predicted metal-dependent phosphoesterase TrpH
VLIEIHTHTAEYSPCSSIRAVSLIRSVFEKGIGGVVFTDHHYLWPGDDIRRLRAYLDVPDDFLLLAGQEVFTRDYGDVLVYGADASIPQGSGLSELRQKYPDAALVWAHPYRSGRIPVMTELFNSSFDAIEVINPRQKDWENDRSISDWKTWGFTATSGTDIHDDAYAELYPLHLKEDIMDINGLAACIKRGLCFPVMGKYMQSS